MLELFFIERFPHPERYSCETGRSFGDPSNIYLFNWYVALGGRGGHKNTYRGGENLSRKNNFNQTSLCQLNFWNYFSVGPGKILVLELWAEMLIFIQLVRRTGLMRRVQEYLSQWEEPLKKE